MDKKNTLLGVLFLVAAFALVPLMNKRTADDPSLEDIKTPESTEAPASPQPVAPSPVGQQASASEPRAAVEEIVEAVAATEIVPEELSYLENDLIEVIFTNQGGAIKKVAMKEYLQSKDSEDPYLFNHFGYAPMLGVSVDQGAFDKSFVKTLQSDREIHFERQEENGLLIRKKFWINKTEYDGEPYSIRHSIEFVNTSAQNILLNNYLLHLGTIEPALLGGGAFLGGFLNVMYYEDGDEEDIPSSKFIP